MYQHTPSCPCLSYIVTHQAAGSPSSPLAQWRGGRTTERGTPWAVGSNRANRWGGQSYTIAVIRRVMGTSVGGCEGGLVGPRWSKTTRPLALEFLVGRNPGPPQGSFFGYPMVGVCYQWAVMLQRGINQPTARTLRRDVPYCVSIDHASIYMENNFHKVNYF